PLGGLHVALPRAVQRLHRRAAPAPTWPRAAARRRRAPRGRDRPRRPGARAGRGAARGAALAGAPLRERSLVPRAGEDSGDLRQHGEEPARARQDDSPKSAGGHDTMNRMDTTLREFFADAVAPPARVRRLVPRLTDGPPALEALADRFRVEASDRGVTRLLPGRGVGAVS